MKYRQNVINKLAEMATHLRSVGGATVVVKKSDFVFLVSVIINIVTELKDEGEDSAGDSPE